MVSNTNRPDWTELHNRKISCGNSFCFVGESSGKGKVEEAVDDAENSAFGRLARNIGVEVNSSTSIIREKKVYNKDKTYYSLKRSEDSVNSESIKIKDWEPKDTHIECKNGKYSAWVLLEIPKSEYDRIKKELEGYTVYAVNYGVDECARIESGLFPAFGNNGINLNEKIEFNNSKRIRTIAEENPEYAYFMKIKCVEVKSETYSVEYYSRIRLEAELYDLSTNSMIKSWCIEKKGSAYSEKDARKNGVEEVIRQLKDNMQDGDDQKCE